MCFYFRAAPRLWRRWRRRRVPPVRASHSPSPTAFVLPPPLLSPVAVASPFSPRVHLSVAAVLVPPVSVQLLPKTAAARRSGRRRNQRSRSAGRTQPRRRRDCLARTRTRPRPWRRKQRLLQSLRPHRPSIDRTRAGRTRRVCSNTRTRPMRVGTWRVRCHRRGSCL